MIAAVLLVAGVSLDSAIDGSGLLILAVALVGLSYVLSRLDWRAREAH